MGRLYKANAQLYAAAPFVTSPVSYRDVSSIYSILSSDAFTSSKRYAASVPRLKPGI